MYNIGCLLIYVFFACKSTLLIIAFICKQLTSPPMQGNDVLIAQTLLARDASVNKSFAATGTFDQASSDATKAFQSANKLSADGVVGSSTASSLLALHSDDGITDTGFTAASLGYLYKIWIPVHNNRSLETKAILYDKDNNVMLKFSARTHGHRDDGSSAPWPDFGTTPGDYGCNQFTSSCATVTGIAEVDLNSPEPDPDLYGPWPINRIVRGLDGNAKLMLPNIRDGLLIHTGNWTTSSKKWTEDMDMPNSSGCVHGHPSEIEKVYNILLSLGVKVNENTFSGKNYPYKPQGIAVIELID